MVVSAITAILIWYSRFKSIKYMVFAIAITTTNIAEITDVIQRKAKKGASSNSQNGDISMEEIPTTHSINNPPNKPSTSGVRKGITFFRALFISSSPSLLNLLSSYYIID